MTAPDITEFCLARIAEERAREQAATPGPWEVDGTEVSQHWSRPEPWLPVATNEVACMAYCYGGSARGIEREVDAEFIAHTRNLMPAVLDMMEAVVKAHPPEAVCDCPGRPCPEPDGMCAECFAEFPCPTVRLIAAVFKDHPDYQQEWRAG